MDNENKAIFFSNDEAIQLIDVAPNAIIITQDDCIEFVNQSAVKLLRAPNQEFLLGISINEIIKYSYKSDSWDGLFEEKWSLCDGELIDLGVQSTSIFYKDKQANYIVLFNITKQKESERILRELQDSYKGLVENSLDCIGVVINDRFVYLNPQGLYVLGANVQEDIIGKHIFTFLHPKFHGVCMERLKRIIDNHEIPELMEQQMYRVDGRIIDIEIIGYQTTYKGKDAVQVNFRDITDRKLKQDLMVRSEKLSTVGQLAAGIAHEIRNPLTSLKGFIELGSRGMEHFEAFLPIMRSEIERIEMISGELLSLANPHHQPFKTENLIQLLEDVIFLLGTDAFSKRISIQKNFMLDNLPINCVATQLKQVLLNIMKNSIESMKFGGDICIEVSCVGDEIQINVHDQGEGIPECYLKQIFEPFFTTKSSGTGLGLMVTQRIIEYHGGSIHVKSKEGEGTTFTIKLPLNSAPVQCKSKKNDFS